VEISKKLRRISTKFDYQSYQQEEILIKLVTPIQNQVQRRKLSPIRKIYKLRVDRGFKEQPFREVIIPFRENPPFGGKRKKYFFKGE